MAVAGALVGGFLRRAFGMYRDCDAVDFVMAMRGSLFFLSYWTLAPR